MQRTHWVGGEAYKSCKKITFYQNATQPVDKKAVQKSSSHTDGQKLCLLERSLAAMSGGKRTSAQKHRSKNSVIVRTCIHTMSIVEVERWLRSARTYILQKDVRLVCHPPYVGILWAISWMI
jgi:hypothetical protein